MTQTPPSTSSPHDSWKQEYKFRVDKDKQVKLGPFIIVYEKDNTPFDMLKNLFFRILEGVKDFGGIGSMISLFGRVTSVPENENNDSPSEYVIVRSDDDDAGG